MLQVRMWRRGGCALLLVLLLYQGLAAGTAPPPPSADTQTFPTDIQSPIRPVLDEQSRDGAFVVPPPPERTTNQTCPTGDSGADPMTRPAPEVISDPLPPALWSSLAMFALAGILAGWRSIVRRLRYRPGIHP